jgi:hypothetical protein
MNEPNEHRADPAAESIEMPLPTAWPMVLALGITLAAAGLVTNPVFSIVGLILMVAALGGWIGALLPEEARETVPFLPPERRTGPIPVSTKKIEAPAAGMPRHRVQLPERVHPYSAGVRGGIAGGIAMAVVAECYGLLSGHGIWYPINLLAGMLLPGMATLPAAQLEQFNLAALLLGIFIHGTTSVTVGLLFGLMLPALPPWPLVWGGVVAPLLWSGGIYAFLEVLNPALNQRVDWIWFIASQFAYGLTVGYVVMRSEKVPAASRAGKFP